MEKIFHAQQEYFKTDETKSLAFRQKQLNTLKKMILNNEALIKDALKKDLNKSSFEAYATEIGYVLHSISKTLKKLKKWMKPKRVKTPLYQGVSKSIIYHEPKGCVLIIGPYNYPFQLIIEPLIGAIAAGNTAIIKPSEFPTHTEKLIEKLLNETFDSKYIYVKTGGVKTTQTLLSFPYDHIFFTGSKRVGQIVYEAASKHLTPITLELGGKSPAIIMDDANLKVTARRIAFGKFINAGQTCIAPDYIYVDKKIKDDFLKELTYTVKSFFKNEAKDFGTIINENHYKRIKGLVDENKVTYGFKTDDKTLTISPTIMDNVTFSDLVMQEEIFGPVLPILTFDEKETMIQALKSKEKPLALYIFSASKSIQNEIVNRLSYGGGAINDSLMHVANANLPFGGVGSSGFGSYHGYYSFETFSHKKSIMKKSTKFDPSIAYPPYDNKEKFIKKLLK